MNLIFYTGTSDKQQPNIYNDESSPLILDKKIQNLSSEPDELLRQMGEIYSKYQGQTKRVADITDLVFLRRLIHKYDQIQTCYGWFFSCCKVEAILDDATEFCNNSFYKLNEEAQSNFKNLVRSFDPNSSSIVKNLNLPGGKYTGSVLNGLPHGQGEFKKGYEQQSYVNREVVITFYSEFTLEGSFEYEIFKRGAKIYQHEIHEGEFKNNELIKGIITTKDGQKFAVNLNFNEGTYSGGWLNDQPHGKGILTTSEATFDGEFKNGQFQEKIVEDDPYPIIYGNEREHQIFEDDIELINNYMLVNNYSSPSTSPKKKTDLQKSVEKTVEKVRKCILTPSSKTPKKDLIECYTEIKELAQVSRGLLKTENVNPKELILSAEKLKSEMDLLDKALKASPSPCKKLIFSEGESTDPEFSYSDLGTDDEQLGFEWTQHSVRVEEFLYEEKDYAEISHLRLYIKAIEKLKEINHSDEDSEDDANVFDEGYSEAKDKLGTFMEKSSDLSKDRIQELLERLPLDELCIIQKMFNNRKKENFDLLEFSTEFKIKKLKTYEKEIQNWLIVFEKYSQDFGDILEKRIQYLRQNPQTLAPIVKDPDSPYKLSKK